MTALPVVCRRSQAGEYAEEIGGKARSLLRLEELGQNVPPWFVVTAEAFRQAKQAAGLTEDHSGDLPDDECARQFRQRLLEVAVPSAVREAVAEACGKEAWLEDGAAVRSSALQEDSGEASFAGLHDSFLFVRSLEGLLEALRKVWASLYSPSALQYRRMQGIGLQGDAMAAVVQQMVDARSSGVLFTANPETENVHQIVISALYGAGEGLVGQGLPSDRWVVDKWSLQVESRLAHKARQLVADPCSGGLHEAPVAEEIRGRPSLTEQQVLELARAARQIEERMGRPQDIEFALGQDARMYCLQSRPITTVEERGPAAGFRQIWESGSIVESWGGITLPLTWSFVRRSSGHINRSLADVLGIGPRVVRRNRGIFENGLGLFRGQICTNALNRSRMLSCMPGFRFSPRLSRFLMRHAAEVAVILKEDRPPSFLKRWLVEFPALLGVLLRTWWNFQRLKRRVADYLELFDEEYRRCGQMDFVSMKPHELMELYQSVEQRLMSRWHAPLVNGLFLPVFHGALARLCERWCGDRSLRDQLVAGQKGLESLQSADLMLGLARQARGNPVLKELLAAEDARNLPKRLAADPRFEDFWQGVQDYIRRYHFRCPNELMLEQPSLKRRPEFLFQMLRNYAQLEDLSRIDPQARREREERRRRQAEQQVRRALGWRIHRRAVFRWVLRKARLGVRNREGIRYARIRMFGLARELMWALADQFASEGILGNAEDFFYLTLEEVQDFLQGTSAAVDLPGLVELRRGEYESCADRLDPPDAIFETFGIPYCRNRLKCRPEWEQPVEEGGLKGIGCSPGRAAGPLKIVRAHAGDLHLTGKEILLVEKVNPAWVALYPSIAGLLIEQGDTLAHSVIVAREMGIPAICDLEGLTKTLRDGQMVSMDGATGVVVPEEEESHAEAQRRREGEEGEEER